MIGVVYCYDIGNQDSFHDIDNWMRVVERCVTAADASANWRVSLGVSR
jgi:hypothetical protein